MNVEDVMTGDVVTLKPSQTIAEAVEKLANRGISGAPVVNEEEKLVGMVTERDILNAVKTRSKSIEMVYPSLSTLSVAFVNKEDVRETIEAFNDISGTILQDIMKRDILYAEKGTDLGAVVELMNLRDINRVPVLESGKLVGIISRADIIKGLAKGMLKN